MGRDLPIDNPRPDAASVIDEAAAHRAQFTVVQLSTVLLATLGHLCLPLLWRVRPSHLVTPGVQRPARLDRETGHTDPAIGFFA